MKKSIVMLTAACLALSAQAQQRSESEMQAIADREGRERAAVDYISGMTDGYAMEKFGEIYIPFAWTVK